MQIQYWEKSARLHVVHYVSSARAIECRESPFVIPACAEMDEVDLAIGSLTDDNCDVFHPAQIKKPLRPVDAEVNSKRMSLQPPQWS